MCEVTVMCLTWRGVRRVVRRVARHFALLWLFVRRTQRGVHLLEVLLQRVLLVKLDHLLTQETEGGGGRGEKREHRETAARWDLGGNKVHNVQMFQWISSCQWFQIMVG